MNSMGVDETSHSRNTSYWQLQDAKARFSEVVRRAVEQGPQHVTVNGEERAVVVSAREYDRLTGQRTGRELVKLLSESPLAEPDANVATPAATRISSSPPQRPSTG